MFSEPWWLDATAPAHWDEVRVERDGELVGRLPYAITRSLGMTALGQPPLTPALGPWLKPFDGKYASRLGYEKDVMDELIAGLPPCDYFNQTFSSAVDNWLPFYWAGFTATVRYTYRIPDISDLDSVWKALEPRARTAIRKAEKKLRVRQDFPLGDFVDLNRKVFARQDLSLPYSEELLERIDEACSERGVRRILCAEDEHGTVHATWYVVWDGQSAYVLATGSDPALRSSGAGNLLAWEAIRMSSALASSFDFLGSMIEPIARFNRGFGTRQVPYFHVTKVSARARPVLAARGLARRSAIRLPRRRRN